MVNIYESAIKPVVDLEDGVTVYVPGYSSIGPEGPTLCSSESEFEGLFGSQPYLFEADEAAYGISKGSPEKGYLYAKSLLASGLKVLFHRVKTGEIGTAVDSFTLSAGIGVNEVTYGISVEAISFGKGYSGIKVELGKNPGSDSLYDLAIYSKGNASERPDYEKVISFDPRSPLYIKSMSLPLIKFTGEDGKPIEDSKMLELSNLGNIGFKLSTGEIEEMLELTLALSNEKAEEFSLEDMLTKLANSGSSNLMYPLKDFERFPSVTYLTTGGYYTNKDVAKAQVEYAEAVSAVALIDLDLGVNSQSDWASSKEELAFGGTSVQRGKAAHFVGCNSFNLSPYKIILGDSFNYLKCLGENMKKGIAPWLPVANDPNGVSPLGYDTTQKIDTALAETMAEGSIGISSNPLIYSTSAGGYKIMGNRTLLSNDGVLSPNSFLNVAVIVNRVLRSARQTANKLKIVSTDPSGTFLKFKQSVAKTIDKMVVSQDGVLEYKIRHLPKDAPATMNIQIHLVVLEGIEKFNIYIPYQLQLG